MPLKPNSLSDLEYVELHVPGQARGHKPLRVRQEWRWQGALHSVDDHPAVIIDGGTDSEEKQWFTHGLRHRAETIGPAWTKGGGEIQIYYNTNEIHRKNGPALLNIHGIEKWYSHGHLHRSDGPAVIRKVSDFGWIDVSEEWYWDGFECANFDKWLELATIPDEEKVMLKLIYG